MESKASKQANGQPSAASFSATLPAMQLQMAHPAVVAVAAMEDEKKRKKSVPKIQHPEETAEGEAEPKSGGFMGMLRRGSSFLVSLTRLFSLSPCPSQDVVDVN
ncbi:unnamed protein product [Dibothriocephalus latus]|uniref:Uncharacterized protein n=1 Tax=Dibothriocephalus latus TaxID=60516 RepID=A0A3P7NUR7_DIBLA|nr:unnamed protein product [Dibothriocephalus latus]